MSIILLSESVALSKEVRPAERVSGSLDVVVDGSKLVQTITILPVNLEFTREAFAEA